MDAPDEPSLSAGIAALQRRWPAVCSNSTEEPVFVLAAGWRSGSTLLQRMLMPSCFVWGEPYGHARWLDSLAASIRCFSDDWPESHFLFKGQDREHLSRTFRANLYPPPEDLLQAQHAFFERLFIEPSRRAGSARWGIKEVRWSADHACYLKWLYPRAKFLFLIRDPYDAYRSYAARRAAGWKWYDRWPDRPLTVSRFGRHWRELASSFMASYQDLDGRLVKYEDLVAGRFEQLESYLGFSMSRDAAAVNPHDGGPPPLEQIPAPELIELECQVSELAASLGYSPPADHRSAPAAEKFSVAIDAGIHRPVGEMKRVSDCVVLVPVGGAIEPECEEALQELERRGYEVRRVRGYAAIDQGRNQMATDALRDGCEETLWIDSDIAFDPDDVERLRRHNLPVVSAIYPKKGPRELASHVLPGTQKLVFGREGGLTEILYAAAGFLLVRCEVYAQIQRQLELNLCNQSFARAMVPFFQPMVIPYEGGHWYLAEDFAFCERVRQCGFKIYADTRIRLGHIGKYTYSWEEAGSDRPKFDNYHFHLRGSTAAQRSPAADDHRARQPEPPSSAAPIGFPNCFLPYHYPGGKIFLNVAESNKSVARALGIYQAHETRAILSLLAHGMTFLDVGAGLGYHALMAARAVGVEGHVLAVEPVAEKCRWLKKSVELNRYASLRMFQMALGSANETAMMHLRPHGSWTLKETADQRDRASGQSVPLRTLDSFVQELGEPSINVMKVDVNGAELDFLRGGRATLERATNLCLLMHLHPELGTDVDAVCSELDRLGFSVSDVRNRPLENHHSTRSLLAQK